MSPVSFRDNAGNLVVPSIINGNSVILPSSTNFAVESSAQQKILHNGQTATLDLARLAVDSAVDAFKTYKNMPVDERFHLLLKAADLLEQKVQEAAARQADETSAAPMFSLFNAKQLPRIVRETAGTMKTTLEGHITPTLTGNQQLVFKEPVGAVLLIMPYVLVQNSHICPVLMLIILFW